MKNKLTKDFKIYIRKIFLYLQKNKIYLWIKNSNIFYRLFISAFLIIYWIVAFILPLVPFWIIALFLWFILIYEPKYVKAKFLYVLAKSKIKYYWIKLYFQYRLFRHKNEKK